MRKGYAFLALDALQSLSDAAPEVDALKWVQVLPFGTPAMNDDRKLRVETTDLQKVFDAAASRQSDIPILYEHGWGPHGGEAAGWITRFEVRADGLWGLVRWTASAAAEIREGRWRYLSPGFMGLVDDDGFIRPRTLFEVSLTNTPAIDGMAPVEATAAWLATPIGDESEKENEDMDLKKIAALLKMNPETATEAGVEAEVAALFTRASSVGSKAKEPTEPETVTMTRAELDAKVETMAKERAEKAAKEKASAELMEAGTKSGQIVAAKKDAYAKVVAAFPAEMREILADVPVKTPSTKLSIDGTGVELPTTDESEPGFMDKVVRFAQRHGLGIAEAKAALRSK